jgi:hypothetical protein
MQRSPSGPREPSVNFQVSTVCVVILKKEAQQINKISSGNGTVV